MGKKPKIIRDRLKNKIIRDISRLFETKKEERKCKKQNDRINRDRIIRNIKTLFEREEESEKRKKNREHNERLLKDGVIRDIKILFWTRKRRRLLWR